MPVKFSGEMSQLMFISSA